MDNTQTSNTPYKGVTYHEKYGWIASISVGKFSTPEEAAKTYDEMAYQFYGPNAALNFPERMFSLRRDVVPIILVMNDAYWLPYTLQSIVDHFEKIIVNVVNPPDNKDDGTLEIARYYKQNYPNILLEEYPYVEPKGQQAYRNAGITDIGLADYYMLIDGDEVWPQQSLALLEKEFPLFVRSKKLYGVVRRIEVCSDLTTAYGVNSYVPHHRLYYRVCNWRGTHPGERATIPQTSENTYTFSNTIKMYHFHNTLRSWKETSVPKRMIRKTQSTYHPGSTCAINILEELPILKSPIGSYPVNPVLDNWHKNGVP